MPLASLSQRIAPCVLSTRCLPVFHSMNGPSGGVSYAAAVSTPRGGLHQPQIQARACSDHDLRSSFELQARSENESQVKSRPQRPGAGIRAKTSFRNWTKKGKEPAEYKRGAVQELPNNQSIQQDEAHRTSREEHTPNTGSPEEHVYVLTLKLEDSLSQPLNELREQYFPRKLNRTPAHVTLFHALPHSQMEMLSSGLTELATKTTPFMVTTGGPFRMRKGVGVNVDAGYQDIKNVHASLQSTWLPFLSEQDAGGFRPHWTVMNKVNEEEEVDTAFHAVRNELATNAREGQAIGLDLWKYHRGNWVWANEYRFGDAGKTLTRRQTADNATNEGAGSPAKRPGMKRGNSVVEAWRSMSFRRKS